MKQRGLALVVGLGLGLVLECGAQTELRRFPSTTSSDAPPIPWNFAELAKPPTIHSAVGIGELVEKDGIRPIFFDGVAMDGRPTRVFAWVGIPETNDGEKVPGVVLVHGGGGTAFRSWVKLWMDRGYAAIAMDTGGRMPVTMEDGSSPKTALHDFSGVPAKAAGFPLSQMPFDQQWPFHAVSAIIRANSLMRSLPEVDPDRVGITGISWGGFLTLLAAGVDDRFQFAAPVYGSGFLGENSPWLEKNFQELAPEVVERWLALWDPSQYVARISAPVLFTNGTNDHHFRPDAWRKTYRGVTGPVTLSMKIRMPHGHPPVGDPKEITVFADSILQGGPALPKITNGEITDRTASISWESDVPVTKAELVFTKDTGADWVSRLWNSTPAKLSDGKAEREIPQGTTAAFFNIVDERGCVVSSEHWDFLNDEFE